MRKFATLLLLLTLLNTAFTQTPGLRWLRSLGGTGSDAANFSFKTSDGGLLMIGSTKSNDKDVFGNHGDLDVWVVKMTKAGIVEWRKCLGGTSFDIPVAAVYQNQSLTIIANTWSYNGDVSGYHGAGDIWVVKLDGNGNILWQKTLGGSDTEQAMDIIALNGGGYAICGSTQSTNGDVTGNQYGGNLWVFRLDENGALQWQKALGGYGQEAIRTAKIIESSNGSLLIGSETSSNNGDVSGNNGGFDAWVSRLSAGGSLVWQKCLGGVANEFFADIKEAADGSVFVLSQTSSYNLPSFHGTNTDYADVYLARLSSSGSLLQHRCYGSSIGDEPYELMPQADGGVVLSAVVRNKDGDVNGYHIVGQYGYGHGDLWLVKVKPDFTVEWQRTLGGSGEDNFQGGLGIVGLPSYQARKGVIKTSDGGYLLIALTQSSDGDIKGYHVPVNPGDSTRTDIWIAKLSNTGVLQWQKTIGGQKGDLSNGYVLEMEPNEFVVTGYSNSRDGDIVGAKGAEDAIVFGLGAISVIKGSVFVDINLNGTQDSGEPFYSGAKIYSTKEADTVQSVTSGGLFINEIYTGTYITVCTVTPQYYTIVPSSKTSVFSSYFQTDSFSFALQPIANKQDLQINLLALTPALPGFDADYHLLYKNKGTAVINNGTVILKKDSRLSFVSATPLASYNTGDSLRWNVGLLNPNDSGSISLRLKVAVPPTVNNGDSLVLWSFIEPVTGDETPADDTAYLKQRVVGSFDPNDKTEANGGLVDRSFIQRGAFLNYLIRFQNTGTDTAFTITVRDTLSNRVEASTLEMIASSHPYTLTVENGVNLTWRFNNIQLPDSNRNERASHGYIAYRIKPKTDVTVGEVVHNTASIYFDYNLPVLTNDALTRVQAPVVVLSQELLSFYGHRQGDRVRLSWQTVVNSGIKSFEIERSTDGIRFTSIGRVNSVAGRNVYGFDDNTFGLAANAFSYRLKIYKENSDAFYSRVLFFPIAQEGKESLSVSPNPVTAQSTVSLSSKKSGNAELQVVNAFGLVVNRQAVSVAAGINVYLLSRPAVPGIYYLRVVQTDGIVSTAFVLP